MYQQKTVDLSVIDDDKRLKLEDFQILKNFKCHGFLLIFLKNPSLA